MRRVMLLLVVAFVLVGSLSAQEKPKQAAPVVASKSMTCAEARVVADKARWEYLEAFRKWVVARDSSVPPAMDRSAETKRREICDAEMAELDRQLETLLAQLDELDRKGCASDLSLRRPGTLCEKFPPDPDKLAIQHEICRTWDYSTGMSRPLVCLNLAPLPKK